MIVTGGSGFLGTNLMEKLINDGFEVLNVDLRPPRNKSLLENWVQGDICDADGIRRTVKQFGPDIIVHMAARTDLNGQTLSEYDANIGGLGNIISCCNENINIQRVIFFSSMLVCKLGYQPENELDFCPTTLYGESKVIGEKLVRDKIRTDIEWSILRPTSIWGPWFDVPYRIFFDTVRSGVFMMPMRLKVYRSYGFVLNSVEQIMVLVNTCNKDMLYRVHYLADHEPIELSDWASTIIEYSGRGNFYRVPMFFLSLAAAAGDFLKALGVKSPPLTTFRLRNMTTDALYDVESWRQAGLKQKYSMSQGVRITINWMNEHN